VWLYLSLYISVFIIWTLIKFFIFSATLRKTFTQFTGFVKTVKFVWLSQFLSNHSLWINYIWSMLLSWECTCQPGMCHLTHDLIFSVNWLLNVCRGQGQVTYAELTFTLQDECMDHTQLIHVWFLRNWPNRTNLMQI
jgi:hypothetical protein